MILPDSNFGPDIYIKSNDLILVIQQKNQSSLHTKNVLNSIWTTLKPFLNSETGEIEGRRIAYENFTVVRCVMYLNLLPEWLNLIAINNEKCPSETVLVLDALKTYPLETRADIFETVTNKELTVNRNFNPDLTEETIFDEFPMIKPGYQHLNNLKFSGVPKTTYDYVTSKSRLKKLISIDPSNTFGRNVTSKSKIE